MMNQKLMTIKFLRITIIFCIRGSTFTCFAYSIPRNHFVTINDTDFKDIEFDTQGACTPDVSSFSTFVDIAISEPAEVDFKKMELAQNGAAAVTQLADFIT
ncbi:MAG: hypothetical protein ACI9LX_000054 [Paraglaciecola sp.]|jgi:hypothetical protein